jgi:hypothetical protein
MLLKYLADDMKTFYYEAAAARPGATPSSAELNDWFFRETQFGSDLLYQLAEQVEPLAHDHPGRVRPRLAQSGADHGTKASEATGGAASGAQTARKPIAGG